MLGHLAGLAAEQPGRAGAGHDLAQRNPACLDADVVQRLRHLGRAHGFRDREPIHRDHGGIADLAQHLRPERRERSRQRRAIVRCGQILRHSQSSGALADAGHQNFLLAAEMGIELALGSACASRDLQRAGRGKATLHERRERRLEDALPRRGFPGIRRLRLHDLFCDHHRPLTWYH